MAIDINKVHLWSNFLTTDNSTAYVEDLAGYTFDNKKLYNARCFATDMRYVF